MGKTIDPDYDQLHDLLSAHGQAHLLRFWDGIDDIQKSILAAQIESIDLSLVDALAKKWVLSSPYPHQFDRIEPAVLISRGARGDRESNEAAALGEEALRAGRVGLVLVAGGQGTRLGYEGPKGAFPIGPVSKRSLFAFHAEKVIALQRRYSCTLPLYIMVSQSNAEATKEFFESHRYFGLLRDNVLFFQQDLVPCVDAEGKLILESPSQIAMNPNGHGGCIPALAKNGILEDARLRGIDMLSYFQVDNWAVKVADPLFIGHHLSNNSEFSSKAHRKSTARESSGVFCRCDGKTRVIEYTEFDIYPHLLECGDEGEPNHYAANAAIHVFSVDFIEKVANNFADFPWHCSNKKIPCIDAEGAPVEPLEANGYKFETFIFDALGYCEDDPVILEIDRLGEFTPTKQMEGPGGVDEARRSMARYWGAWLEAAGCPSVADREIEISPQFALTEQEFIEKTHNYTWPDYGSIAIGPDGELITD